MSDQAKTERDLVIELRDARKQEEDADLALTQAKERTQKAEDALIELMETNDATSTAKYDGIGQCILKKPRLYASFNKADEPIVFDFLKKENRSDLIKQTVNAATLSSFVKEYRENGKEVPDFIKVFMKPSLAFNQPK